MRFSVSVFLFSLLFCTAVQAETIIWFEPSVEGGAAMGDKAPVDIEADEMSRDENADVVSASGNVIIKQSGRVLQADDVQYNVAQDTMEASGGVVLVEINGDIYNVDRGSYANSLEDGEVENLSAVLVDGSRFTAERGRLKSGVKTTMEGATYTPCEPCVDNPDKAPPWGIVASEVEHDREAQRVNYKNARFEVKGVPVAYTPYFSHSDGSVKQKSGFLAPSGGYSSDLGVFVESSYYWAIDEDQDATFGVRGMTQQAPLGLAEYRKRWADASLIMHGGVTSSDRTDRAGDEDFRKGSELRGHISGEGRWDINEKWRSGVNVEWASDDQYMRQYDITEEDVLENEVYVERFSGRNYASGRVLSFQDIRIQDIPVDQPNILPEIVASFKGEPGAVPVVKGQWSVDAGALGVQRDGQDQSVQRLSLAGGWNREMVSDFGLVSSANATLRGDAYYIDNRAAVGGNDGEDGSSSEFRAFPQAHIESRYPLARDYEGYHARIEPVVALTVAPQINNADDIPNEDSTDVQIDASNLFEANRFSGIDRQEDQSRVTYGVRTGVFGDEGSFGDVFVGQSYRLDKDENPFPNRSGLEQQSSDYVGQVTAQYKDTYDLDYRFQVDRDNLASRRHEIYGNADWNRFRLQASYLYGSALGGTNIVESREQASFGAQYYLNDEWRTNFGAHQDLGENSGLRTAYVGVDYLGQCVFWSLTGQRNYTRDSSGESDAEILFRVGLKNLGEFETSDLRPY